MFDIVPFNAVFFVTFGIFLILLIVSSLLLKNKSRKTRRIAIASALLFTFASFWVYKYYLSIDAEYSAICAAGGIGAFSWWKELPLQLCNINMIIIPLAAILDNKRLYAFGFLVAPLGAFMALIMPSMGFTECSIFLPRCIGYYFTHFMIFFGGIAVATFGLYKPKYKDLLASFLTMMGIFAAVTGIDFLLAATVEPNANYMFALNPEGISILELFWKIIPVKGLYLICGAMLLIPYMLLVTTGFFLGDKIKEKTKKAE